MGLGNECDCVESLTRALGGWDGTDRAAPIRAKEPLTDCLWCGQGAVDPTLGDVNRVG